LPPFDEQRLRSVRANALFSLARKDEADALLVEALAPLGAAIPNAAAFFALPCPGFAASGASAIQPSRP
jgi:hypothetical protein